ncbi:sugar ABC transporter substrate-binding protein [Solihabitans fulvus]|uniref:Sugar ABC transporter substrate-binding protein n=1 Tax=Solihabitans fulvus TaxID=1892852 RepID=A0A5B2XGN1_9PSEU|nr:sugar ABC transporter substrate-binding protein [Solihabitans fulvus]KAA2262406.1 sugar ABC transporter substrate-binding protein [Solihabitans fulvus]
MKGWKGLAVGVTAVALAVAGCGSKSDSGSGSGGNKTLTVWLMTGSAPTTLTDALNKEFADAHPGVKVDYQVQQWDGIQQKLTTALASKTPPDVIELGNTQTAQFADQGTLTDLSGSVKDLNGDQWLAGLKESGAWKGKQYGFPFYAANRTVIYRKDLFQAAGIAQPPTSNAEWLDDIAKLKAANASDPEFQSLYLPGQSWYSLLSFIWDNGGDVATKSGDAFKAALDTPGAKAGVNFYKQLVDASGTKAPKDTDEAKPQQSDVFGKGKVAMMLALPWEAAGAIKADPTLKDKVSAFPIPSKDAGKTAPVFLGGSNLSIPATSQNADLAKDYLKLLSSAKYQGQLAKGGAVPGTSTDVSGMDSDPIASAMGKASKAGKVTPITPKWGPIEAGQNPLKNMLTAVLTGAKSVDDALAEANAAINKALS